MNGKIKNRHQSTNWNYLLFENLGLKVHFGIWYGKVPWNQSVWGCCLYALSNWDRKDIETKMIKNHLSSFTISVLILVWKLDLVHPPLFNGRHAFACQVFFLGHNLNVYKSRYCAALKSLFCCCHSILLSVVCVFLSKERKTPKQSDPPCLFATEASSPFLAFLQTLSYEFYFEKTSQRCNSKWFLLPPPLSIGQTETVNWDDKVEKFVWCVPVSLCVQHKEFSLSFFVFFPICSWHA